MGDAKHLYRINGAPYYGVPDAGYMPRPIKENKTVAEAEKPQATKSASEEKHTRKKNTVILIDAEGIGADKCSAIIGQAKAVGEIAETRYFARQNDESTKAWKEAAKKYGIKPVLCYGEPEHNKIDKVLIRHARKMMSENKGIDIFCIAARDGDFRELAEELRDRRKRVVILAPKNTSQMLKKEASDVRGI